MSCDPEWDDEVDVVCTDAGMAGLATAIAAVDEDGEVFLASAPPARPAAHDDRQLSWFAFGDDDTTDDYRGQLTADLDVAELAHRDADLPIRLAGEPVPARLRPRPPFEGERLRDWAAQCIPAPSGYLYTQVTDWTARMMDCGGGELLKVAEIGSMTPDVDDPVGSVLGWLTTEALDRGVTPEKVHRFDRLVFEDGKVTGAVFSTDSGPLAIRARHGVLVCRKELAAGDAFYRRIPHDTVLRVALVGKDASRFGRVELLTSDAEIAGIASQHAAGAVTTSRS